MIISKTFARNLLLSFFIMCSYAISADMQFDARPFIPNTTNEPDTFSLKIGSSFFKITNNFGQMKSTFKINSRKVPLPIKANNIIVRAYLVMLVKSNLLIYEESDFDVGGSGIICFDSTFNEV